MTSVVTDHRDVARALCATLATHAASPTFRQVLSAECVSARDLDRFITALSTAFATFLARKVSDPEAYLLAWVATELQRAEKAEQAADDGPGAVE